MSLYDSETIVEACLTAAVEEHVIEAEAGKSKKKKEEAGKKKPQKETKPVPCSRIVPNGYFDIRKLDGTKIHSSVKCSKLKLLESFGTFLWAPIHPPAKAGVSLEKKNESKNTNDIKFVSSNQ